ncbi:MAG: hypothetical protein OEQ39_22220 [Gammaproteobacteria bacterium]|nr:hypothetical protein [Gammaproteobacteria bacterium]MDH3468702.1 hypothetical protein [Gammaproteobacteria bacterium]
MIVNIDFRKGDNDKFLTAVSSLIAVLVKEKEPKNLYVTRINKWFDHKWLKYSGRGRVKFDGALWRDTAHDAMWRGKLTFPPFNPKQVGDQFYWHRSKDGTYSGGEQEPRWIHKRQLKPSSTNLQNRVVDFTDSGLFVWFTSNTDANMHGSVMVYVVDNKNVSAWYASFKKETDWKVEKTKGIDRECVEKWFPI